MQTALPATPASTTLKLVAPPTQPTILVPNLVTPSDLSNPSFPESY